MEVGKCERSRGSLYSVVLISQWSGGKFFYYWWVRGLRVWSSEREREVDGRFEYSQSLSVMGRKADQGEIKGVRATWGFKSLICWDSRLFGLWCFSSNTWLPGHRREADVWGEVAGGRWARSETANSIWGTQVDESSSTLISGNSTLLLLALRSTIAA